MIRYRYMIADEQNEPLSRAVLESPPSSPVWSLTVLDGGQRQVLEHSTIHLISMTAQAPDMTGRILSFEEDGSIEVEPLDLLGASMRQNLRVPVRFESFLYPVSGAWRGRVPVVCHDLSCGGVAFYCDYPLAVGEIAELVVPITAQPLLLYAQILRRRPSNASAPLYSAKFIDLIHDEEVLVREAVFSQQIANRDARRSASGESQAQQ